MIEVPEIKPCPCCGRQMVEVKEFATRASRTFIHESDDDDRCVLENIRLIISSRGDEVNRLASWNRRADRTAHFREGWNLAVDAATTLVRKHQIADASSSQTLEPRYEGNRAGLAYADGIAALALADETTN